MIIFHNKLPEELNESIEQLIHAVNSKQELVDCEVSQVLADINMSESWGLISTGRAKELRGYYVYSITEGEYGSIL